MNLNDGTYIVTQTGCTHCENYKTEFKNEFDSGNLKELNISNLSETSKVGKMLFEDLQIDRTPSKLVVQDNEVCLIDINTDQKMLCTDLDKPKTTIQNNHNIDPVVDFIVKDIST